MGMWDMILGGGGALLNAWGAIEQNQMAREDRDYWKGQTGDALQRIDEFRDQGQVDLQRLSDTLRPGYDSLADNWAKGAQSLTSSGTAGWDSMLKNLTGDYAAGTSGIQGLSGDRMSALGSSLSDLQGSMNKAYGDRTAKGMSMLAGYGDQAKADIRQDFGNATKSELARLGSVGLGNTSAGAVTSRGMARGQSDAMNRLNEGLTKIGLDTYSGLSGDQLASQSGLGQFGIGMMDTARGQDLSQRERLLNSGADLAGTYGSRALEAKQDLGEFNLSNQVAASRAQLGEQERLAMQPFDFMKEMMNTKNSTALDWGLPPEAVPWQLAAGQGLTNAWNVLKSGSAAKKEREKMGGGMTLFGFGGNFNCLSADTPVRTRSGAVRLADVEMGDEVLGEYGSYHRVVAKDCGIVDESAQGDLLVIHAGGFQVTCTPDHVIEGTPAEDWRVGDLVTVNDRLCEVTEVSTTSYVPTADIMLSGNVPYIANGFVIHSSIGVGGIQAWRRMVREVGRGTERSGFIVSSRNPDGVWALTSAE